MPINESRWVSREALIELLGEEGAARVVKVLGGTRTYLPAPDAPGFPRFAAKLGEKTASMLCTEFGEVLVTFPRRLVPLREEIIKLDRKRLGPSEIARRLGCVERYVYMVLSRQ